MLSSKSACVYTPIYNKEDFMKHIAKTYSKTSSPCHCMNIRRASRAITEFYDLVLKPSGLTSSQLSLLRNLAISKQTSISNLAKILRIDRTTLNRNLKPLIDAALISQTIGVDSRTRVIELTPAGEETLATAWSLWKEAQQSIKEYMGDDELAQLMKLAAKLEALTP